jgi:hypothetical protein
MAELDNLEQRIQQEIDKRERHLLRQRRELEELARTLHPPVTTVAS